MKEEWFLISFDDGDINEKKEEFEKELEKNHFPKSHLKSLEIITK